MPCKAWNHGGRPSCGGIPASLGLSMETKANEPIRLSEGQTEMLTKALAEAAEQAALPKAHDTEVIGNPLPKPVAAPAPSTPRAKKSMVI